MDEYQIVELVKDWYREGQRARDYVWYYVLLNGNRISFVSPPSFHESNKQGQISDRTIGLLDSLSFLTHLLSTFEFPIFDNSKDIVELYVYKRGYVLFDQIHGRYPLPNLKYFICGVQRKNRLAVELLDLDVVANNLNLPNIMSSVLGSKLLSENEMKTYEFYEIRKRMLSQKLFAGHTWYDAEDIVSGYFDENERELSKEVLKISQAYERVFRPYRVVYNTKTWQPVLV
jgi:hypothetical protein